MLFIYRYNLYFLTFFFNGYKGEYLLPQSIHRRWVCSCQQRLRFLTKNRPVVISVPTVYSEGFEKGTTFLFQRLEGILQKTVLFKLLVYLPSQRKLPEGDEEIETCN